jgi:hypothetical protein
LCKKGTDLAHSDDRRARGSRRSSRACVYIYISARDSNSIVFCREKRKGCIPQSEERFALPKRGIAANNARREEGVRGAHEADDEEPSEETHRRATMLPCGAHKIHVVSLQSSVFASDVDSSVKSE